MFILGRGKFFKSTYRNIDDVLLNGSNRQDLQEIINDQQEISIQQGLRVNSMEIKTMINTNEQLHLSVSQTIIAIRMGWSVFARMTYLLKNQKIPQICGQIRIADAVEHTSV